MTGSKDILIHDLPEQFRSKTPVATIAVCICSMLLIVLPVHLCAKTTSHARRNDWNSEAGLLSALGLPDDASDADIMELFDVPSKRPLVITLIRYRKITSASGRLLQVVSDEDEMLPIRISAAKALNTLGNKQWVEPLRSLVADPNSNIYAGGRLSIAALLANEGDSSQFKILIDFVNSPQWFNQAKAVREMGNISGKNSTGAENIVDTLVYVAKNDSDATVRWNAVNSLSAVATGRREFARKLMEALEANINSSDEGLRSTCETKMSIWRPRLMTDEQVLELLEAKGLLTAVERQIQERKLQAAVPILLEIVRGQKSLLARLEAAGILVSLGNTSWLPDIRPYVTDPNAGTTLRERISVAGVLAQGRDYSQFELVASNLSNEDPKVRLRALNVIRSFRDAPDPIGRQMAELLEAIATTDPNVNRRATAIRHLEEMVDDRPEFVPALISALEANLSPDDGRFHEMCQKKLKKYRQRYETP